MQAALFLHSVQSSDFTSRKALTLLVCVGLFWCFHNAPSFDMDDKIFHLHREMDKILRREITDTKEAEAACPAYLSI